MFHVIAHDKTIICSHFSCHQISNCIMNDAILAVDIDIDSSLVMYHTSVEAYATNHYHYIEALLWQAKMVIMHHNNTFSNITCFPKHHIAESTIKPLLFQYQHSSVPAFSIPTLSYLLYLY